LAVPVDRLTVQYLTFWRHRAELAAAHGGPAFHVDPAAVFGIVVCLFLLAVWTYLHVQRRSGA
jgi:hypothetical protein